MTKTNVMRMLENAGISYETASYPVDESDLSGEHAASELGIDPDTAFKTLVCRDEKGAFHVFCVPVSCELDLKKCAVAAGVKRVEMIHVRELLPLTGYLRGGCSPIGMKKKFPTLIDETATLFERIYVSAGVRGTFVLLDPRDLVGIAEASFCDLV